MPIDDWIVNIRREFHMEPELSFKEFKTQKMIIEVLDGLGIRSREIADTGVVATIDGGKPGPCIAIRADIDALEVTEEPTFLNRDYISRNRGFMHACGHDCHIAMVLGAARMLKQENDGFRGSVRLIFQPAEELPPGGAIKVIGEGGLDGVDGIIGMHIFGDLDAGKISCRPGSFMASSNMFNIRFLGKDGHHSNPADYINPIIVASEFISSIDREVRKHLDPQRYVLGMGKIEGGAQFNRAPEAVHLLGSFRTFDDRDTQLIEDTMRRLLDRLMGSHSRDGIENAPSYELDVLHGYPVLVNEPGFAKQAYSTISGRFADVDPDAAPVFGSEDFAYYLQKVPGVYLTLGTRNVQKGIVEGNHSSRFDVDEDMLMVGTQAMYALAMDFLERPEEYLG